MRNEAAQSAAALDPQARSPYWIAVGTAQARRSGRTTGSSGEPPLPALNDAAAFASASILAAVPAPTWTLEA
jgi:hypothetical protein